jgi:hypothetical protein
MIWVKIIIVAQIHEIKIIDDEDGLIFIFIKICKNR